MHLDRIEIDTSIEVIVVSFPGRWWHHNDLYLSINSYNLALERSPLRQCIFQLFP